MYKQLTSSEWLVAKIRIIFIHSEVFTVCVKGVPKPDLKTHPSSPSQATSRENRSCAFPLSEMYLNPPCFEQRANRTHSLKKLSKPNVFPVERHGLEEGTLQGYNFAADQVTLQRQVEFRSPVPPAITFHGFVTFTIVTGVV